MKIVIDIPEDLKKMIFDDEVFDIAHSYRLAMCVKNGTPLPMGHGRLIDADALIDSLDASDRDIYCKAVIEEDAPTIIEAYGGDEE